jgi:hypothetical protein
MGLPQQRRIEAPPALAAEPSAPLAELVAHSAQVPTSLAALRDTERRVAEEIRLGTIESGAARIALEHLRRAKLVLRVAVKGPVRGAEAAPEVTICWLCSEPIVPDRLADPADVFKHMSACSGWTTDRRGKHGKPEKKWRHLR